MNYLYSWKMILPGQAHSFTPFFNAKFSWSIWSPQGRKPFIGNWRSTGYKLQQTKASFVVKSVDSRPEPNNHRMSVMVSWPVIQNRLIQIEVANYHQFKVTKNYMCCNITFLSLPVLGISSPICYIDFCCTCNNQFQLSGIEHSQ